MSLCAYLWKTVQHHQDYLFRWLIKFRTQCNTKTGPQADDVLHILRRQRERDAVATAFSCFSWWPFATPEWRWIWHASKVYGITGFMLSGLYRNIPIFLEDNFLILEHKVTFGCIPYASSVLIYNKANLRDLIAATGLVISNWIQIVNFSARVTVKFDGWPCNTIGHLFYATSSFVHHFVAIGEFKLQLQSGNAQSGSNSTIFRGVRPWNLMDDLAKQ